MKTAHETAKATQTRLRRVEGRHNLLVKKLRRAFASAELTEEGDCAVEGLKILEEAIRSGLRMSAVFFRESAQDRAERLLPQLGTHVETLLLPDLLFNSVVPSDTPQGVAALVRPKRFTVEDVLERRALGPIVVLAGIQDPGNVGTIIRSAEAFGSAGMILARGTVSPFNSKVIRASAGSAFRLPIVHGHGRKQAENSEIDKVIEKLRSEKMRLIATSSHKGTPLAEANLRDTAIFFGNEGAGLPRDVVSEVDEVIAIPHAPQVDSLNAGVAASIVLYEAARQRR
jgi:RNA methyltransferase, TrmH family